MRLQHYIDLAHRAGSCEDRPGVGPSPAGRRADDVIQDAALDWGRDLRAWERRLIRRAWRMGIARSHRGCAEPRPRCIMCGVRAAATTVFREGRDTRDPCCPDCAIQVVTGKEDRCGSTG